MSDLELGGGNNLDEDEDGKPAVANFTKRLAKPKPPTATPSRGWRRFVGLNAIGVLLLVGSAGWSGLRVLSIHNENNDPNVKTIRISHWQLESGYREAMQSVIDDYNAMHAAEHVRIVQVPVTERIYGQWLNVNLIADNAPDIAELGMARLATTGESVAKYFMPLGREVLKPNPYDAEKYLDDLEERNPDIIKRLTTAPWRETMVDGMRGGYKQDLQDYYSVPMAFFTQRMFYNRDLLREITGTDQPPQSLGQLFALGERIRAWGTEHGRVIDPIAGTRYHRDVFVWNYRVTFTNAYQTELDTDVSGSITPIEAWAGWQSGKISLKDPALRAYFEVVRKICEMFNPNFAAMDRDQAIAAFASGKSAMMATGSWDGQSIFNGCKFSVGVMNFPMPAPGEPYADYGKYSISEASSAGGSGFGITRNTKYPEISLDFLRFISSHKWNQKLNRKNGWLPIAVGTTPAERMVPFMPTPYGVISDAGFGEGYEAETKISGQIDRFFLGEITYEDMRAGVDTLMADPKIGFDHIWFKAFEKERDQSRSLERTIAVQSARQLMGTGDDETSAKLLETILDQAIGNNGNNLRHLYQVQNGKPFPEEQ